MSFLAQLQSALNAQNFPPSPKGESWNKPRTNERYYGPACASDAHLFLLWLNSADAEDVVMENLWYIHRRGLAAQAHGISPDDVTEKMIEGLNIRDGWKWYIA